MAGGNVSPQLGPLFVQAGNQYKIPPQVLAGIASVETNLGGNISTSSTGAQGLMQFEPGTARALGVNPGNIRSAIFGAAKLLNQYGYQQNPTRAIGAYNGGPGNPQYGYASQVLSEANRLKGQLAGYTGKGSSSTSLPSGPSAMGSTGTRLVTTPGMSAADQATMQRAQIASQLLSSESGRGDPFNIGPKTGVSTSNANDPLAGILGAQANPANYAQAQQSLQKVAGSTPLAQHPAAFQANLKSSGYTNPLPGATWERTDQGVDASLSNGSPIHAIGDSKVVAIRPNWYRGQPYVQFQFLNGPSAGKFYYIAEAINPSVRPGQTVRAGQVVGTYNSGGTGLELGWGTSGSQTLAQATTGYTEGQQTPAGKSFRNFLNGLGARAG